MSSDQPRRLGQAASTVRATVEALNTTIGRPVSAIDICEALTNKERQTLAPRRSALRKRVARVLDELARRHILGKVKDGRTPVFFVPGILPEEACKQAAKPSRRRRVLSLVYTTVIELQRAVRVADVVEVADASGVTEEIPAHMIKRDLANLVRTGELRIIDTVRGDGGGSNLYLPSDLDPAAYAVDDPLTWLEELHTAFQFEWAERVLAAELSDQRVVPPSTSDVRARFRAMYPGHEKLSDPQLLVNGLRQLAGSGRPRLRPVRRTGQRALLWAPIHVQDADLDLGGSYASDTERVVEAVARAMAALGAPAVRVEEVQDEIDRDTRLRPAGRQPLYVILSDAARTELISADGSRTQRATPRIDRVGVVGGSTYYAVGNTAGALEYLELLRLRIEWNELRATEELDAVRAAALPSIRAGRALQLAQVCEAIAERARTALPALPQVALVAELVEIEKNASARALEARAVAAQTSNSQVPTTVDIPTDGFTPAALLAIIAPRYPLAGDGLTTARLVPLVERQIKRIPNPRFTWRFSSDPDAAAEYLFDSVSALCYMAFRWGNEDEQFYANLAATTLGRLRDHRFVMPVLESQRFEERLIGVACLMFLGDPDGRLPSVASSDPVSSVREAAEWGIGFVKSTRSVW